MCSIIGLYGIRSKNKQEALIKKALSTIVYRGQDAQNIITKDNITFAHCLHAMVSFVPQPLEGKGIFTANCEIYNWKALEKKYKIKAKNDADLLFQLLEKDIPIENILNEIDGTYAFAYSRKNKNKNHIILARDILGIKPLWYSLDKGFSFASERKALAAIGVKEIFELNPRKTLMYSTTSRRAKFTNRSFFTTTPEIDAQRETIEKTFQHLLEQAVNKRIPEKKFGLLFSGGLDSTILAAMLKMLGKEFTCYLSAFNHPTLKQPEDIAFAKKAAEALGLKLKIIQTSITEAENGLKTVVPLIEDTNATKAAIALTFFEACKQAKKDGCKALFSGLGADEICGGYERQRNSGNLNKECLSALLKTYEKDLYRDDVVGMFSSIEMRMPFLDKSLVEFSLRIPSRYKSSGNENKLILKNIAKSLGIPREIIERKKRGAQYGSRFQTAIDLIAKKNGFSSEPEFLKTLTKTQNPALGALISTGKDSWYAALRMVQQNYFIKCMITLQSKNPDSFMFHTPAVNLARLQSKASGIPLVSVKTEGKEEAELLDLKKAFEKAKKLYKIEGIISGAIHSSYQRDRIERIADGCSLKIFTPLWHSDQANILGEMMRLKFKAIITAIAADGLDGSWLGRAIDNNTKEALIALNKKSGINIAGEGGEYESLVLDCPMFNKGLLISKAEKSLDGKNSGRLRIAQASLISKGKPQFSVDKG